MTSDIEPITQDIDDAVFKVHKELSPSLYEPAFQSCRAYEPRKHGRIGLNGLNLPILYGGQKFE